MDANKKFEAPIASGLIRRASHASVGVGGTIDLPTPSTEQSTFLSKIIDFENNQSLNITLGASR